MSSEEIKGLVYNLQHFAIHDGPGIRTLVYMKGCPLGCLWCSTPQTQQMKFEILHIETSCKQCGRCVELCPNERIRLLSDIKTETAGSISMDRERCTYCRECVDGCPNQAYEFAGKYMGIEELFKEVEKDSPFYRRSNGGVTVGGGEATLQHEFVAKFLERCKKSYIHTAMETCGYVKWEHLEKLLANLDLIYTDIKHMDPKIHKEITHVSNELILENIKKASSICPLVVRIPVIPGLNDSRENIAATAKFAAELGNQFIRIELLPYHKFGTQTYERLGMVYELSSVEPPLEADMNRLKLLVESHGVTAQIGG